MQYKFLWRNSFLFALLLFPIISEATTYTFQSNGNYSIATNWDTYPGTAIENGDTLLIQEDIYIDLFLDIYDGVLLLDSNVEDLKVDYVTFWDNSKLIIESSYLELTIYGQLDVGNVETPNLFDVLITNYGNGITSGYNIFEYVDLVSYDNYGTQYDFFFQNFTGLFWNEGVIQVFNSSLILTCTLDLRDGSIEGFSPFGIVQQAGVIYQTCDNCISTTINCVSIEIINAEIEGEWIIN